MKTKMREKIRKRNIDFIKATRNKQKKNLESIATGRNHERGKYNFIVVLGKR